MSFRSITSYNFNTISMKNLLTILLFFVFGSLSAQNENTISINSKIKNITVYIDGAEISENANFNLVKGRNLIVFKNISNQLILNTIRVSTDNSVNVLSISSKTDYLMQETEKPRIKSLKDSVNVLKSQIRENEDLLNAYSIEKDMLLKNASLGGTTGVTVNDLKLASAFYREKILEINRKMSELTLKSENLLIIKDRIEVELLELNSKLSYSVSEIQILVSCENAIKTELELKYLVSNAGWTPSYDLKVSDINTDIELTYRAQVFNNTGIDWNNVKLKLSSGDPSISAQNPTLKPWNVDFTQVYKGYNEFQRSEGYTQNIAIPNMAQSELSTIGLDVSEADYLAVEVSELSIEFDIAEAYSIPCDNKPYFVDVAKYKLPATYKHFCIPKIDKDVFLLARITGWQDLNLVEGAAHVYFAGTYVGKSYIYTRNVRDTLDLSLGRDKKILVTRSKLKEYSSVKLMGAKRKETFAYQMVIKNNRNTPINIEIQDQFPISTNSEIEIEVLQISNGKQDLNSGKLTWEYNLKSGENKVIDLQFAIKYPKNSTIQIEQSKTKMMRNFK